MDLCANWVPGGHGERQLAASRGSRQSRLEERFALGWRQPPSPNGFRLR